MKNAVIALDKDGDDMGLWLEFEKVHGPKSRQDLLCATSHVWIYNSKGELLLQKRGSNVSTYPNCWDISAAGHVDFGESPEQAAIRETAEEIGLSCEPKNLEFIKKRQASTENIPGGWKHDEYVWVYLLKADELIKNLRKQDDEVTDLKWMDLDKFEVEIHDSKTKNKYVPHNEYYDFIITEIRKRL